VAAAANCPAESRAQAVLKNEGILSKEGKSSQVEDTKNESWKSLGNVEDWDEVLEIEVCSFEYLLSK
jgi:hypothetical protein